jgi:G:T-mismatch repair DNA endonuclease (very short patch repair protein)
MQSNDQSHELLLLHMELQRSVAEFARLRSVAFSEIVPWECEDNRVAGAKLTDPRNLSTLEEWLKAERANAQRPLWTEEALRQCRERAKGNGPASDGTPYS